MKVSKAQTNPQKINFKGMKKIADAHGDEGYKFYLPYDDKKYNAFVEFAQVDKDGKFNWQKPDGTPIHAKELKDGHAKVTPWEHFSDDDRYLGYRFRLESKTNPNEKFYHNDMGVAASNEKGTFSVIDRARAPHNQSGPMMHLMPDNFNPGYSFDKSGQIVLDKAKQQKALEAQRTHFNQMGGNIAGIIEELDTMKDSGVKELLYTPLFGKDELSSHGYWTTNPSQISRQYGTAEDFDRLNVEVFKRDMQPIADGAFVNEGLEGMNFRNVLKWGDKEPRATWFKAYSLRSNPLTLGVIPSDKNSPVLPHLRLKIVNAPDSLKKAAQKAGDSITLSKGDYDKTQPTFVQLYDNRLVSEEQKTSNQVLRAYDELNTANHHEIINHNDSVILYAQEVEPAVLERNIKQNTPIYEKKGIGFIKSVLKFPEFEIGNKGIGGVDEWDGNVDIPKRNTIEPSKQDEIVMTQKGFTKEMKEAMHQGVHQVQDDTISTGAYWTRRARNSQVMHTLEQLKAREGHSASDFDRAIQGSSELPVSGKKAMSIKVIKNILDNNYELPLGHLAETKDAKKVIIGEMMKHPLESVEFSDDLTSVLSSPFISKRAAHADDVGVARIDIKPERMPAKIRGVYTQVNEEVYEKEMKSIAFDVIKAFDKKSTMKLLNDQGGLTEAGRMVVPMMAPDIARYAVTRAFAPDAVTVDSETGKVSYDLEKMRKTGLRKVLPNEVIDSPEKEAKLVATKLEKGIAAISDKDRDAFAETFVKKFAGLSTNDVKVAHVLVNRAEGGLNWRMDATKDFGNIDHLRNGTHDFQEEWPKVINFVKKFNDAVRKENPNSYMVAEMTDMGDFLEDGKNAGHRFSGPADASRKFVQETGASTLSNYEFFYSDLPKLEGNYAEPFHFVRNSKSFAEAMGLGYANKEKRVLRTPTLKKFQEATMVNATNSSHNFVSNHDKPRILHVLAMDMEEYHQPKVENETLIKRYFHGPSANIEKVEVKGEVSAKAVTTAQRLESAFCDASKAVGVQLNDSKQNAFIDSMSKFVRGEKGDPESFGTKDFRYVIPEVLDQAVEDKAITKEEASKLTVAMHKEILEPAYAKLQRISKLMTIMPGNPTMYAGDEYGMTGFETPNKNIYVQNRNAIPRHVKKEQIKNEKGEMVVNPHFEAHTKAHFEEMKNIQALRSVDTLSALNTGETVQCAVEHADPEKQDSVLAMLRYNDKDTLLCLGTSDGFNHDHKAMPAKSNVGVKKVTFDIGGGVKEDTVFVDVDEMMSALVEKHKKAGNVIEGDEKALGRKLLDELGENKDAWKKALESFKKEGIKEVKQHKVEFKDGKSYIENIHMHDVIKVLKQIPFRGSKQNGTSLKVQAYLGSYQVDNRPTVAVY